MLRCRQLVTKRGCFFQPGETRHTKPASHKASHGLAHEALSCNFASVDNNHQLTTTIRSRISYLTRSLTNHLLATHYSLPILVNIQVPAGVHSDIVATNLLHAFCNTRHRNGARTKAYLLKCASSDNRQQPSESLCDVSIELHGHSFLSFTFSLSYSSKQTKFPAIPQKSRPSSVSFTISQEPRVHETCRHESTRTALPFQFPAPMP